MRGRKPKPTELKRLAGNPGKRPLNPSEPQLKPALPQVPRHLDVEARREWRRVVRELHQAGLLTRVDRAALAAYCQAYSRWTHASRELDGEPLTLVTASGYRYPNPLLGIQNNALETMRKFMTEFGMTPSSRSRVKAEKVDDEPDELERLLFRGTEVRVAND